MLYKTKRQIVKEFIETHIVPRIIDRDLRYDDVINLIVEETNASEKVVKETMKIIFKKHDIIEERFFTINKEKLQEVLKKDIIKDEVDEEIKEVIGK